MSTTGHITFPLRTRAKGTIIKKFAFSVAGAGILAATALGLAGPAAADGSAADTVNGLQSDGYLVQLNGTPTTNLTSCTVTNVKKDSAGGTTPTAYVDISCPTGC